MKINYVFVSCFGTAAVIVLMMVSIMSGSRVSFTEKSIVKVLTQDGNGGGTGFVTNSATHGKVIVTNDHVCAVEANGFVLVEDDNGIPSEKQVIKRNMVRDLCLVQGIDAPALTIAKNPAKRFDAVKVLGHPGLRPTAPAFGYYTGNGIVPLGLEPNPDGTCKEGSEAVQSIFGTFCVIRMELGYTTVPVMPGNSGSPITNADGEVVGVINSTDTQGFQGMFIPLAYLKDMLNE